MEIVKVLVMVVMGGQVPAPVAIVQDVATCRAVEASIIENNPELDGVQVLCVPLPQKALPMGAR